jgi:hypothetical protein
MSLASAIWYAVLDVRLIYDQPASAHQRATSAAAIGRMRRGEGEGGRGGHLLGELIKNHQRAPTVALGRDCQVRGQVVADVQHFAGRGPTRQSLEVGDAPRVISDCHFSVQLNNFIPVFLSYSVAFFRK